MIKSGNSIYYCIGRLTVQQEVNQQCTAVFQKRSCKMYSARGKHTSLSQHQPRKLARQEYRFHLHSSKSRDATRFALNVLDER